MKSIQCFSIGVFLGPPGPRQPMQARLVLVSPACCSMFQTRTEVCFFCQARLFGGKVQPRATSVTWLGMLKCTRYCQNKSSQFSKIPQTIMNIVEKSATMNLCVNTFLRSYTTAPNLEKTCVEAFS